MDPTLKDAVLGGQQAGVPTSPLGDFPELAKFYAPDFASAKVTGAVQSTHYNDAAQAANAQADKVAAIKQRIQQIQDLSDPSKYQRVPKQDGGYTFLDPTGKEVSAYEYSRVVGKSPADVVADSQNPVDQGFTQDYKNLQDFMQAVFNKDTATVDKMANQQTELKKYEKDLPGLMKRFYQAYPTIFGQGGFQGAGTAGQKIGTTYVPSAGNIDVTGGSGAVGG